VVFCKFSFFELTFILCLQGSNLQFELDSLHGQATVLAALVSISPKLPLGYPTRLIVSPPPSFLEIMFSIFSFHTYYNTYFLFYSGPYAR
jgi:hypothetical protein